MEKARAKLALRSPLAQALIGEGLGTFVLVLTINCVVAQSVLSVAPNKAINVHIGVGLGIAFGIAICARISGGHINPAVSLMFFTFRQLSFARFLLYSCAQTVGALLGAIVTHVVYYDAIAHFDGGIRQVYGSRATAHIFASYPSAHLGWFNGLLDQVIATAVFCLIIAHTVDKRNFYPTWVQPFIIGLGFVLVGSAMALNAGYPNNPARDFAPRLWTLIAGYGGAVFSYNDYAWFWVPVVGPLLGGLIGGWTYQALVGFQMPAQSSDYAAVASGETELKAVTTTTTKP